MGQNYPKPENPLADEFFLLYRDHYERVCKQQQKKVAKEVLMAVLEPLQAVEPGLNQFPFDMSGKKLPAVGFTALAAAVAESSNVVGIRMRSCDIDSEEHVRAICTLLKQATLLHELTIADNNVGIENGLKIVAAAAECRTLRHLDLSNTGRGDASQLASNLAAHLRTRTASNLETVKLAGMDIGSAGAAALIGALEANVALSVMDIGEATGRSDKVTAEQHARIAHLQERNGAVYSVLRTIMDGAVQRNFKTKMRTFKQSVRNKTGVTETEENADAPTYKLVKEAKKRPAIQTTRGPDRQNHNYETLRLSIGIAEMKGRRMDMEDVVFCKANIRGKNGEDLLCVFDGHGSKAPADYACLHLPGLIVKHLDAVPDVKDHALVSAALRDAFLALNKDMAPWCVYNGTTALILLLLDQIAFVANIGDTRAVIARNGGVTRLSVDHKPDAPSETERVEAAGGSVKEGRVNGILSVSRAFGDSMLPQVIAEPYVTVVDLSTPFDCIVLACDGVWDVIAEGAIGALLNRIPDVGTAAVRLRDVSYEHGSQDNISVVVVRSHAPTPNFVAQPPIMPEFVNNTGTATTPAASTPAASTPSAAGTPSAGTPAAAAPAPAAALQPDGRKVGEISTRRPTFLPQNLPQTPAEKASASGSSSDFTTPSTTPAETPKAGRALPPAPGGERTVAAAAAAAGVKPAAKAAPAAEAKKDGSSSDSSSDSSSSYSFSSDDKKGKK